MAYRDHLPWVLDRLENVWRTIDSESRGRRTEAFAKWWADQKDHHNRRGINQLRNAEVKRGEVTTRGSQIFRMAGHIVVGEDGSVTMYSEDGQQVERTSDGHLVAPEPALLHSTTWRFAVPSIDDRSVQDVLETVFRRLEQETLPTAERLLLER